MSTLFYSLAILVGIGVLAAVILFFVAKKFKVEENPLIEPTEKMLPGANCGGCGFAGCHAMAEALVKNDDISSLFCPVGGSETMKSIADFLGKTAPEKEPQVAVVRCNGAFCNRQRVNVFNGADSCIVESSLYSGETLCSWGCLGKGDCTKVCKFGAIKMNSDTGLPEVDQDKCTACGACVNACPKGVIELRKKGIKDRRIFVSCINKDKGGITRKACSVGCIGCMKCVKVCAFEAIKVENNVAYIDASKCRLCRKCVVECPTGAIQEVNLPPRKPVASVSSDETGVESKVEQN